MRPRLVSSSSLARGSERRRRRGSPRPVADDVDDRTRKNRRLINCHLKQVGKELCLGNEGICYFQYKKFITVVEVPDDQSGCFFIYTMVSQLGPRDNREAVLQAAMRMNYMQQGTRGACLGLEEDEINLCYSAPVNGTARDDFIKCLEDFLTTADEMNKSFEVIKAQTK